MQYHERDNNDKQIKILEDDLTAEETNVRDLEAKKADYEREIKDAEDSLANVSGFVVGVIQAAIDKKHKLAADCQQNIDTAQTAIKDKTDVLATKRAEVQKKQEDLAKAAARSSGGGSSKRPSSGSMAVLQLLTDQGMLVPGVHYTTCDDGTYLPRVPSWVEHLQSSWVMPGNSNVSHGVVSQAAKFIDHVCKPKPARIEDILKRLPDPHASLDDSFDPNGDGYLPGIRGHKGLHGFIDRAFGYGPFMDSVRLKFPLPLGFGFSHATFWGGVQPLHESLRLFRVLCDKWSAVLNVPGEVVQFTLDQAKIPTSVEKVVQAVEASVTQPGLTAKHVLGVESWGDALEPATPTTKKAWEATIPFALQTTLAYNRTPKSPSPLPAKRGVLLAENDDEDEDLENWLHVHEEVVSADGEDEDVASNGDPDSSSDDDASSVSSTPTEVDDRLRQNRIQARIDEERELRCQRQARLAQEGRDRQDDEFRRRSAAWEEKQRREPVPWHRNPGRLRDP
ncbi:hypothetical protein PG989_005586 [Apiospora arundinis]